VHDRAQRAVVPADSPRAIHLPVAAPAARASRQRHADRPPGRQRIAAPVAHGRCERKNRSPARRTDWPRRRMFEQLPAGCAGGCEKDGEDGVCKNPQGRRQGAKGRADYPPEISIRSAFPHRRSRP
jgi:hypothetical protein